jgi:H+/Cl- antiporter ClcA
MKDWDLKIVAVMYALLGSFLGFLIFTFAFDNIEFVFLGKVESMWRGPLGLFLALGLGAVLGLYAWRHRHYEFRGLDDFTTDEASAMLFTKRIMVLISCSVGAYFIWQLAKGI